ncbi:hypothetical protein EON83_24900 [bacterium]|nr:MAG: hypothetical protein EON83_24900 [bacterium]
MRQIGVAVNLYTQDYDEQYPPPFFVLNGISCEWPDEVYSYIKSEALFKCPSNTNGEYRTGCPAPDLSNPEAPAYHGSYAMQQFREALSGPRLSQFEHPSSTATFHDTTGSAVLSKWGWQPTLTEEDLIAAGLSKRHQEGNNVLFADGHVKWLTRGAMAKRSLWVLADTE